MPNVDPQLGLIVATTAHCRLKGQSWPDIPTLVWPDGIDEAASDWIRTLVVKEGLALSSAHEYLNVLRPFLRLCRRRRRAWESVDDEFLVVWREHLLRTEKLTIRRVNMSLKIVFAFYRWAEEERRIRYRVGIYTEDECPASIAEASFPISAVRFFSKGRHGRVYGAWTTPLTQRESQDETLPRHTPTEDEIRELHKVAVESRLGERDSLILSWAEEAGPRRMEFLQVGKSHMPSSDQLAQLIERDEPWTIQVKRKGGATKSIFVPVDLIVRTLDFIQFARQQIVERCREKNPGYREPDELFLSNTTGLMLHKDSVTTIGRRTFKKADVRRANVHRLRARFAVRTLETLVDAIFDGTMVGAESSWVETILIKASEMMGHASPESLRPYLTYVLNRRIQNSDATKAAKLSARLRQLQHFEGTLVRRLSQQKNLQLAAKHLQAGRSREAASVLRALADDIASGNHPPM